ncbi:MAG: hypothetical protein PHS37_03795 [Candidatus Omnitrophica bacterium]|nr:hypothetical protein [Candidatus Omnitrophota bacterium]
MVENNAVYRLAMSPPLVFIIVLGAASLLSAALSRLAYKRKNAPGDLTKPYACGEENFSPLVQPDYSQFFPFAFFFTFLHVVALIIATVPTTSIASFSIAVMYIIGAVIGLSILYRR